MSWTGWLTNDEVSTLWVDAPEDEFTLTLLVEAALAQVTDFAPAAPEDSPTPVPPNFKLAQLMQTRNLWNASQVDTGGGMGEGDFVVRPFPLDWQVKALLRPKRGIPLVG